MGSDVPVPHSIDVAPEAESEVDRLRRQLRRRLERLASRATPGVGLTVLGLQRGRVETLRHAVDPPERALLGVTLPECFQAVAAIAPSVFTTDGLHREAWLAIGVTRRGDSVAFMAEPGRPVAETFAPSGWLIDACRRAVGLSSDGSVAPPLDLSLAVWLDRVMVHLVAEAAPLTWKAAAERCPVPSRWSSTDPIELASMLATLTTSWASMRAAAIRGEPVPVPIEPAIAAWMDTPMFARWCLGFFPDLDGLLADFEFLAPTDVADCVAATITAARALAGPR